MSQIKNKFIEAASGSNISGVTDQNLRLRNDQSLRARNAANSADVNILKVNASDIIEMQGNLSLNSNRITNLADPINPQDAATRAYVLANAGAGTVTSVALAAPAIFSVSGSPVTSSGTLTLSYSGSALPVANGGTNSTAALNNNRVMVSSSGAIVEAAAITANRALSSDANGIPVASSVTDTELGYLSGVTSAIQTQLDGKANTALSNLASVAINTALKPATNGSADLGTSLVNFARLFLTTSIEVIGTSVKNMVFEDSASPNKVFGLSSSFATPVSLPSGNTAQGVLYTGISGDNSFDIAAYTANNASVSSSATGSIRIETGNKTAGTGNSGSIFLFTGTSSGGDRGSIVMAAKDIQLNASTSISANSIKISDVGSPTLASDAATKGYVDQVAQGLKPKQAVRVGTTANITLSSAPSSIDGITLSSGNRVLVKDQTSPAENGIYIFNGTGNAMTRSSDFDSLTPIDEINGAYTFIQEGTQEGQGWVEQGVVATLNTDPIVFVHFTSTTTVIGGDMITVTGGDTISVDLASTSGLESTNPGNAAGQLRAKVDAVTVKINGSNSLESLKQNEELITLNSTDITNQYVDLAKPVYGTSASGNSIQLTVIGGPLQQKTVDYTVSLTGGAGGVTRVTFAGGLATGGASELVSGDILAVSYSYLT